MCAYSRKGKMETVLGYLTHWLSSKWDFLFCPTCIARHGLKTLDLPPVTLKQKSPAHAQCSPFGRHLRVSEAASSSWLLMWISLATECARLVFHYEQRKTTDSALKCSICVNTCQCDRVGLNLSTFVCFNSEAPLLRYTASSSPQ